MVKWLIRASFCAGLVGLTLRTVLSGHLPIFGTLENTWTAATVILGTVVVTDLRDGPLRPHSRVLLPWAVIFLVLGFKARFGPVPLTISEQSVWVDLHVFLAWAGFVALLWAGSISAREIVRGFRRKDLSPDADRLVFRLMAIGYLFLTGMILAGSWYLFVLFATFWRWEIVGSLALLTWVGYSIAVHGWLIQGWRGARLFWVSAILLIPLVLMYWVWSVFPGTYHFFDIPLLTPY